MPRTKTGSVPSYRLHKQSGQAVVTLHGPDGKRRDHYLGVHGSPESWEAYARAVAEMKLPAPPPASSPSTFTVAELMLKFLDHAEQYYRRPDGTQTSEVKEYKRTIRAVRRLYGSLPVAAFTPLKLEAVRRGMVDAGLARGVVNQRVGRVVRMFKWGVSQELCPAGIYQALATVGGLREGRSEARETEPVAPVAWEVVEMTLPHLNRSVRAMVRLMALTGMRPGEVCGMKTCEVDTGGPVWFYRPPQHKTRHKGKGRVIALGPKAQEVLQPFLRPGEPGRVVFSPRDFPRGSWGKTRRPREDYTVLNFCDQIAKTCARHGIEHWHPHQLRHAYATTVRGRFGLDAAQVALGHKHADVTQVYAEADAARLAEIASAIG